MTRHRGCLALLALVVAWAACTDATTTTQKPGGPDAGAGPTGPATALFELPRPGMPPSEFYALPFPNDLRRNPDGTIDFAGLAPSVDGIPLLQQYLDVFSKKIDGFGTNAAIFFRFSGEIDSTSLPATPADSVGARPSVYLVDVDPRSPHRGDKVPLRFRFERFPGATIGGDWLSCLPYPGFPLRARTTYAAVVTRRVRASDGTPVARAADLDAVLRGGGDAAAAHARAVYAPLLDWLDALGGDARDDVADATVFTTQDPAALMPKIRQVIQASVPAPVARDVAAKESTASYQTYEGVYDAPNFQSGTVPYLDAGGEILLDDAGMPKVDHMEALRFALTVPKGTMPAAGWPIVVYAHGTGGDYRSFINDGTAGRMAAQGLAAISIDQVLHGPRDPTGHNPELTFFNFENPVAARDNVRQGALDDFQLVRLAKGLVVAGNRFDATQIDFMGHSQGGLTGPPFLAAEPDVRAAILSGAGALIYIALIDKTEPIDITGFVKTQIKDDPLDEFNPFLALIQTFIEPADPANYGPLLVREPLPGVGAKDIFQTEGFVDHYAPDPGIEAFGVSMGLTPLMPVLHDVPGFALRGVGAGAAPLSTNLAGRTAVFAQYDAGAAFDGHFVVFRVPAAEKQSAQFLGTLARTGTATVVAP